MVKPVNTQTYVRQCNCLDIVFMFTRSFSEECISSDHAVPSKRYAGQQKLDTCNKQVYLDL
jgi:hypothetical protein